ncbi:hypothetical protein [Brevundimonas sp.]|uniref:hypothetical protein n=1 Tax=Brevundimonas sp. TaxID=1871086 RepID=UPI002D2CD6C8|nr:hypothetical protein [Brevundimonas sp.]HYC68661.1 hypothetical protein [Brevundimonas sp.]
MLTQSDKADAAADKAPPAATPRIDPTTVVGWGVDADPENDPTWPMRDRSKDDGPGMNWARPPVQDADVEILQSVEHKRQPATIGTSTTPAGLSGALRRQAFRFSESQWGHWLLLILADRINTVEGLAQDVRRGRMPNPLVEMGVVPQSRSREAAAGTAALFAVGLVAGLLFLRRRR